MKTNNIPKDWEETCLGNVISLEYGKGLPESERHFGGFPIYGSNGIIGYHDKYLVKGSGIIVGRKGTAGAVSHSRKSFWPIDTTYFVRYRKEIDEFFVFYLLSLAKLERLEASTGVPGLNRNDAYKIKIQLPNSIKEQQKIASILLTIDKAIAKSKTRIEKNIRIKQGLMRDVLNNNSWRERPAINELYMKGRIGWQGLKADEFLDYGKYYLITGIHFTGDHKVDWSKCYRISRKRYEQDPLIQVKKDDVIITKDGTIGKVAFIDKLLGKASLNSHLLVLRPLKNNLLPRYLFYQLLSKRFERFIDNIKTGSTLTGLSQKNFGKYQLFIPSIDEQRKVISILDSVNNKIESEQSYLEKLLIMKSGMMQDLLTGQVRVAA